MIIYCIAERKKGAACPRVTEEIKDRDEAIARCKELRRRETKGKAWSVYAGDTLESVLGEKIF